MGIERPNHRVEQAHEHQPLSTEQVRQNTQGNLALSQMGMYMESGDPQHMDAAVRTMRNVDDLANRHRSAEEMIAAKDQIITTERLNALPTLPGNVDIRGGGNQDEQKRLRQIKQRLSATMSLKASDLDKRRRSGMPLVYLVPHGGTFKLKRDLLEQDLAFVSDPTRIDADPNDDAVIPAERERVFTAYRDILAELVALNRPIDEERYQGKYGSVLGPKELLRQCVKTPGEVKNAGRFLLFVGAMGLLALWGVKDYRNGTVSLGTAAFGGLALWLANMDGGTKFDFVKTKYFAEMARNGFDGDAIKKLQSLPTIKLSHIISVMEDAIPEEDRVSQATVNKLINPTKKRGGKNIPDPSRAIPEEIAQLFLGQSPGGASKVVMGIKSTARNRDREMVSEFANANANHVQIQQELAQVTAPQTEEQPTR